MNNFIAFSELNNIISLTINATTEAATIHANLRKQGKPIGHTDSLITGIALTNKLQLATNNVAHFVRVERLEIVNWIE